MFDYKTIEEKAQEWGITPRHAQYLCRKEKIEGAIKRAGVWFIPDNTPNPLSNTKPSDLPFKFVGTKKKIFESSIKLFNKKGYENVSINDIAEMVGIRQSAVYNHFRSKQEILDTIYGFFHHHYASNRPTNEDLESMLRTDSILDIVTKGFIYEFEKDILEQMTDITRIIIQRAATDVQASELFRTLFLEAGISFVESGLDRMKEVGRIDKVNTHTISVLINCVRLYTLLWWVISPPLEAHLRMLEDEQALYRLIANILSAGNPAEKLESLKALEATDGK